MDRFRPAYLSLLESGELEKRAVDALSRMTSCDLCAHYCRVNRLNGQLGKCRTGRLAVVHGHADHRGEELPIRGDRGSGTIFFSHCNLQCLFCQNWEISQRGDGVEMKASALAQVMLSLQEFGCYNINLVSPSHVVAQIIDAIYIAAKQGLYIPIVYNTGGYDSPEALKLLDGIVDIYMPDMKYGNSIMAKRCSNIDNYVEVNQVAVKEMHRQVGDLTLDENGVAQRGLLIRHLVMPDKMSGSVAVLKFIKDKISTNTYINLMAQYHPAYNAKDYPPLDRSISYEEFSEVTELAKSMGLNRLD